MADTMSGALQLRSAVARKVYYEKYEGGQEEAAGAHEDRCDDGENRVAEIERSVACHVRSP